MKAKDDVSKLASIAKTANKALEDIGYISEFSKEDITELMMEEKLEDGKTITFDDDSKAPGTMVYLMDAEGGKIPLPVGSYQMMDGSTLSVEVEGTVGPAAAPAESMEEEMPAEGEAPKEEMEGMPKEEMMAPPTELESMVGGMTEEAVNMMVEEMVIAKLEKLGIMPKTEMEEEMPEEEMAYTTADKPEEMSKEGGVEEFNHSPSASTGKKADTTWSPSKGIGVREAIQAQLRNA